MEHIPDDQRAAAELTRVLKPGGPLAVTVPTWLPETICWALSDEYHAPFVAGGHVRIFTEPAAARFRAAGSSRRVAPRPRVCTRPTGGCKCAVGPTNDDNPLVEAYLRLCPGTS